MEKIYIDICDNFKLFLRLQNKKLDQKFLQRRLLLFQFFIYSKFHVVHEKFYRRKRIIILYIAKNKRKEQLEKKINNILMKEDQSKILLSNSIVELIRNSNYCNIQNYMQIQKENKNNFRKEIVQVVDFIFNEKNKRTEEKNIYVLAAKYYISYKELIILLAKKFKTVNIITNSINDYQQIENSIYEGLGIHITVSNNKRKSLARAEYIINMDFSKENIMNYNIFRNATIFNLSHYKIIPIKGFDGNIINNVIFQENDRSFTRVIDRRFNEIYDNNFTILDLIGNNGSIKQNVLTK